MMKQLRQFSGRLVNRALSSLKVSSNLLKKVLARMRNRMPRMPKMDRMT